MSLSDFSLFLPGSTNNKNTADSKKSSNKNQIKVDIQKIQSNFKKLIDQISKYPVYSIHLHGYGEPLIDQNLIQKKSAVRLFDFKGVFSLFTNSVMKFLF
jgi:hypothetical protein